MVFDSSTSRVSNFIVECIPNLSLGNGSSMATGMQRVDDFRKVLLSYIWLPLVVQCFLYLVLYTVFQVSFHDLYDYES